MGFRRVYSLESFPIYSTFFCIYTVLESKFCIYSEQSSSVKEANLLTIMIDAMILKLANLNSRQTCVKAQSVWTVHVYVQQASMCDSHDQYNGGWSQIHLCCHGDEFVQQAYFFFPSSLMTQMCCRERKT